MSSFAADPFPACELGVCTCECMWAYEGVPIRPGISGTVRGFLCAKAVRKDADLCTKGSANLEVRG